MSGLPGIRPAVHIERRSEAVVLGEKCRQIPRSIGVLVAPDMFMPIGEAPCKTQEENGLAVWVLRIGKEHISGRWIIVDREFRPAK